jgi:secreted trypsin-like serine protease
LIKIIFFYIAVTPRHVLFAAHCLQDKNQKWIRHALDSFFYFKNDHAEESEEDDNSAKAYISKFIVHPDWDPDDKHYTADIAIAVLKEPVKLSNNIRHVCLNTPSNPIQSFAGRSGKVYGWGLTDDLELDSELRHVDVPFVDQALCNASHNTLKTIMSDTSFCAGARDGQTGACIGK